MNYAKLRRTIIVAGVAAIIAIVGIVFVTSVFNQPRIPNVKFIDFRPEGTAVLRQGQMLPVTFNIVNNEQFAVSGVSVWVTQDGQPQFFDIEPSIQAVEGTVGANGGRTGLQTVNIYGNTNDQDAVEADFKFELRVIDGQLSDTKTFKVRLEK